MIKRLFRSSLIRNASYYTIVNGLNRSIPFLLMPVLTRYLTPGDYGVVAMFSILTGVVGMFTGLNTDAAIGRLYFERDTIDFPKYIFNCLSILIISSGFVGIILYLFSGFISHYTEFPSSWLWTVLVFSICQYVILIILTLLQVQIKPFIYGSFQILQTSVNFGLTLLFVVLLSRNWEGRIQAQLITVVLFAFIGLSILLWKGWIKFGFNGEYALNALKFGVPLIPHTIGGMAMSMADRILITNMVSIADTGIYTVGAQIGMIIGMIEESFNQLWVPWLFRQLKKEDNSVKLNIVRITYIYNVLILLAALALAFLAPWFLSFFVGKDFTGASKFVFWIALGWAFDGMYKMVANYLFFVQKTYLLALVTFLTGLVNIISSYFLIKLNGAVGAAQGMMLGFFCSFILTWLLARKAYKMPWNLKPMGSR